MGREQLEELRRHGYYLSVPHGVSMRPMIDDRRGVVEIRVPDREIRRYDVVMYDRGGVGVIHRVLHVRPDHYEIAGDNCRTVEIVPKDDVAGIAVRFMRNGKWHDCTELGYRIYAHVWTDLFFIRRPVFRVRDAVKRRLHKTKTD